MAPKKKKPSELKSPAKTFTLSQPCVKKIMEAVKNKDASSQTDAIETAIHKWDI